MKKLLYVLLIAALLVPTGIVLGSDVSNAIYYGAIRATNNSTSTVSNVAANVSISTPSLISAGILNSTANNCAVRYSTTDMAFMPGYGTNPWVVWFSSVLASGNIDEVLYTNSTGGNIAWFPGSGGMTVPDNDNATTGLELSDNGSITLNGRLNTSYINPDYLLPNGAGDNTSVGNVEPVGTAHYLAVDDPVASSDNATTYAGGAAAGQQYDTYNLINSTQPGDSVIDSVTVVMRVACATGTNDFAQPFLRLNGVDVAGTERTLSTSWASYSENITRPGGGSWSVTDLNSLQVGIGLRSPGSNARCTQIYCQVNYDKKYLVHKANAVDVYIGATNNLTAKVYGASGTATLSITLSTADQIVVKKYANYNLIPNGTGNYTNIGVCVPNTGEAHWQDVDDPVGSPDDATSYVKGSAAGQQKDAYTLTDLPADATTITGVTVYYRAANVGAVTDYAQPFLRLGTNETTGTEVNITGTTWVTYSEVLARPGGGSWSISDLNSLQVAIGLRCPNTNAICSQIYVTANYTSLSFYIDGNLAACTDGVSVNNSNSALTFCQNGAMDYVSSVNMSVGGVPRGSWSWQYGATFEDSVNSNDATPTFRTDSSDSAVSASLIAFTPIEEAIVSENTTQTWPSIMTTPPVSSNTTYTEAARPGIFFEPIIYAVSQAAAGTWMTASALEGLIFYFLAFLVILAVSVFSFMFFAAKKINALFIKIFATAAVMIFFSLPGLNIFGYYVAVYYIFFATGIFILSKDYGW